MERYLILDETGNIAEKESAALIIQETDINNWNEAHGWGDHKGLYLPQDYKLSFFDLEDLPAFDFLPSSYRPDWTDIQNIPSFNFLPSNYKPNWIDIQDKPAFNFLPSSYKPSWLDIQDKPTLDFLPSNYKPNWVDIQNKPTFNYLPSSYVPDWSTITNKPDFTAYSLNSALSIYNTADQVTNYEKAHLFWTQNYFKIQTEQGGTGASRTLWLDGGGVTIAQGGGPKITVTNQGVNINGVTNSAVNGTQMIIGGTFTQSGVNIGNVIAAYTTINQSGTAGYRGLFLSLYEQTLGSGNKFLIDAGTNAAVNGGGTHTSKFSVSNAGEVIISGSANGIKINDGGTINGTYMRQNVSTFEINAGSASGGNLKLSVGGLQYSGGQFSASLTVNMFGGTTYSGWLHTGTRILAFSHTNGISFHGSGNTTPSMFISTANNIIIGNGTTDGGYKLDVNGSARIQNTLFLSPGTLSIAPLNIPTGVLKTTANPGDIESDGGMLYFVDNTSKRIPISKQALVFDFDRTTAPAGAVSAGVGIWNFTLPSWVSFVELWIVAGGTGGGSGRRGAPGTNRTGGAGGGSGGVGNIKHPVSVLGSALTITVGAGGAGGAAVSTDDTNGNNGLSGGLSSVAGNLTIQATAQSGVINGGIAGTSVTLGGNFNSSSQISAVPGGIGTNGVGGGVQNGGNSILQGGGGGGGLNTSDVAGGGGYSFGGTSGNVFGTVQGGGGGLVNGGNGNNAPTTGTALYAIYGGSGSGGGANATGAGGKGGDGFRGGGGGGGGASANGFPSGAGGKGGDGFVRIICYA